MSNPYELPTKDEQKTRSARIAEAQEAEAAAIAQAKKCLGHQDFKAYREKLAKAKDALIRAMLSETLDDPMRYSMKMWDYSGRIKNLEAILGDIERDARREPPQKPEEAGKS